MLTKSDYRELRETLKGDGAFEVRSLFGFISTGIEITIYLSVVGFILASRPFSPVYWLLEIFLATSAFRSFVLMHECGHYTLFKGRRLNDFMGTVLSPFCLLPYVTWRDIHWDHHKWVGVIDKDPTQAYLLGLENLKPWEVILFRFFWKSWLPVPFIRFIFSLFWGHGFRQFFGENRSRGKVAILSTIAAGLPHVAAMIWLGPGKYFLTFGPMIVFFYATFELVNLPQHSGLFPFLSHGHPKPIPLTEQDAVTRSTHLPRFFAIILTYNFNLHIEHHLFPAVPWHSLPKVTDALKNYPDVVYQEEEIGKFMWELRKKDPIDVYIKALPKVPHEKTEDHSPKV